MWTCNSNQCKDDTAFFFNVLIIIIIISKSFITHVSLPRKVLEAPSIYKLSERKGYCSDEV